MSQPDSPEDRDRKITAALAEVARLGRHLDDFDSKLSAQASELGHIGEMRSELASLSGLVRRLLDGEEAESRGERAIWWPDYPAGEERTAGLRLLGAWVDQVLLDRHPEAYRDSLRPCWYLHTDVLDELPALRAAWHGAYRDQTASVTAAIEWHDRWLPGCLARCKAAMKALACDKNGHQKPRKAEPFYDSAEFRDFVEGK